MFTERELIVYMLIAFVNGLWWGWMFFKPRSEEK